MSLRRLALLSFAIVLVLLGGCARKLRQILEPNQAPAVRFELPRVVTKSAQSRTYEVRWKGLDPDGHVDHYLVAIDPPSSDPASIAWMATDRTSQQVVVAEHIDGGHSQIRRLVVRAVDDLGAMSPVALTKLNPDNVPPSVRITCPLVNAYRDQFGRLVYGTAYFPGAVRVEWQGDDSDGTGTHRPTLYKYILLGPDTEFPPLLAISNPDSFYNYYAHHPSGPWTGWTDRAPDSTFVTLRNLASGRHLFAVIAFDEQGEDSHVPSLAINMLSIVSSNTGTLNPRFRVFAEDMEYGRPNGLSPAVFRVQVPEFTSIRWHVEPDFETCDLMNQYRWVLDPAAVDDFTPRSGVNDIHHWSAWSQADTLARLGPFQAPLPPKRDVHLLYVEGDDGLARSRAIISLIVVPPTFTKDVLIVDDTRLRPDFVVGGALQPPSGPWPTAAELDTFLYARGGVTWQGHLEGTVSLPGMFHGYSCDTLGTRGLGFAVVPLSTLLQYRRVIWIADGLSAALVKPPNDPVAPETWLRFMGGHGPMVLATYVRLGGKLWLMGGGAAYAISDPVNDPSNDVPTKTYSSASPRNELGPGRFMYDIAKWQSEYRIARPAPRFARARGRFAGTATYSQLPAALHPKSPITDLVALEAPGRNPADFYQTVESVEFLQKPNPVVEDVGGPVSTLDTLFRVSAPTLPDSGEGNTGVDLERNPEYPVMTYAHGPSLMGGSMVTTGFPIWFLQRGECRQIVDFVMHDLWGLNRAAVPAAAAARRGAMTRSLNR